MRRHACKSEGGSCRGASAPSSARRSLALLGCICILGAACAPQHAQPDSRATPDLRTVVIDRKGNRNMVDLRQEASVGRVSLLAEVASVWAALHSAFDELGIEVTTADVNAGLIGNSGYDARSIEGHRLSRYFDCGSGLASQLGDSRVVTVAVMAHVQSAPKGVTVVTTTVDAFAHDRALSGNPTHCVSRGRLERRIADLVQEHVGT